MRPVHASDATNLAACERKATLARRTERQGSKPGSAAHLGTAVHACMDQYVKTGDMPDESTRAGRIAIELVPHVPPDTLGTEVPFSATWRGYPLGGTIDLVAPGVIVDWKTTSDWSRRPATLAEIPQPAWYSAAVEAYGGPPPELRWIYVHTSTLQVRPLVGRLRPDAIEDHERSIVRLLTLDQLDDPMSAPPNRSECSRYGGCPFLPLCGPEPVAAALDRVKL